MVEPIGKTERVLRKLLGRSAAGRLGRKPPRRGRDDGGEPVPAAPKPGPVPLAGGAEAPLE